MKLYTLKIKDTTFKVLPVTDEEEMKKGLSGKPKLGKGKGMLFHFGEPREITMNMGGMKHPIDMIFIDGDRKVKSVKTMEIDAEDVTVDGVMCVLEVNKGAGIGLEDTELVPSEELVEYMMGEMGDDKKEPESEEEPKADAGGFNIVVKITSMPSQGKVIFKKGGSFKMYEEDVKANGKSMQVLDDGGRILMNIDGGERIFSIEDTDNIISLSKKIDKGEADEEELGKLMETIIQRQDTQEPEYV
jgi:uncharacterized membrane protein (UPF0127 family)